MNTKHQIPFNPKRNKGKDGPKFRRWSREEIIADTSNGYYSVKTFLAHLEVWRLLDIERRLESLYEWGAWRLNSEQKAEVRNAIIKVREEIQLNCFRTKVAGQGLRLSKQGRLNKKPPTAETLKRRKKAAIEQAREAVANYYKKRA